MASYIQKQIREHPFDALVRLPVAKVIKLFQLGASTGMEETFEEAGHPRWGKGFKAIRFVFAPIVLLLAAIGSRRFLGSVELERLTWVLLVFDFTVAYVFFSEVSPVYSFYCQFVLLACAAEGVTELSGFVTAMRHRISQPDRPAST